MSVEDLEVLRFLVKSLHSRKQRLLRGVEIGPWLGRSTLNILAPDFTIGSPNSISTIICDLMTLEFNNTHELLSAIKVREQYIPDLSSKDIVIALLYNELCYLVKTKKQYFASFYCVDTWGGIDSEQNVNFREGALGTAKNIFISNISKAGFIDIVTAMQGDSSILSILRDEIDFIFIDADHEYDSIAKDLFAVRHLLTPSTFLCGHDFGSERWPGVKLAVDDFIKYFEVASNIWIAKREGIEFLQSLLPYDAYAERIDAQQHILNNRYSDPDYCLKYGLKPVTNR
ncbi:MAG: class I SAM-dependent methyltransferase [Syntrophobacteraceae bacterium]